ncbi:MAG: NAD(P)-binding protein [Propionicimonas sp.]
MTRAVEADYLVVGAGAMGMAFADALVTHSNARVAIVDRRHAAGGHWLEAYPFVRLHQASLFYGVASTRLGDGRLQATGPEAGLQERATGPEVCAYYGRVLDGLLATGRVEFFPGCEFTGGRGFRSLVSGTRFSAPGARLVDATYLAGEIPGTTAPPFQVGGGVRVVPVNDLARLDDPPGRFVIVGAGKTAADACVWLLQRGVDPGAICWVRPREPWLLNRAVVQPDAAVFQAMAADTMEAVLEASDPDGVFRGLEERGVMLRIDRAVTPTMAKTPTLARWELELLRSITDVVRQGHLRSVEPGRLWFAGAGVRIPRGTLVVHCAAAGLPTRELVPIWQPDAIRPRPVRVGFPCFGAAVAGYVEATRPDDAARNAVWRPSPYSDTPADWVAMQVVGGDASQALSREPDVREWANTTTLNPARVPADRVDDPAVVAAMARLRTAIGPARARLVEFAAT